MLILSRFPGERIFIEDPSNPDAEPIVLEVRQLRRNHVRLGIQAPPNLTIVREPSRDDYVLGAQRNNHWVCGCRPPRNDHSYSQRYCHDCKTRRPIIQEGEE